MSGYLVLARKYRSESFDQVVGQEPIAETLINAININRIHHAYLFTGTRGVGKTTMARILAKALNCMEYDAPTATPCGKCPACVSIARGDDVDVVEIDGASNRGIDEMRELRANAVFRPARCRFKVYYIDEVHQVTKDAFNSLLKTLEEPPAHVKFIFATTEVEKIPATILSRCQRFDFRNIPTARIADHLGNICQSENVPADQDALFRVARAAAGSMRDSLSLLDQILAGSSHVTDAEVIRILGTPPDERTLKIFSAIASSDSATALCELSGIIQTGVTLETIVRSLGEMARNMMLSLTCGPTSDLIELPETQKNEVAQLAQQFSIPAVVQAVGILNNTARNIRNSSVARALVEASLVRLANSEKFVDPASLVNRLEQLATGGAGFPSKKPIANPGAQNGAAPGGYQNAQQANYNQNQNYQQPPQNAPQAGGNQYQPRTNALFRKRPPAGQNQQAGGQYKQAPAQYQQQQAPMQNQAQRNFAPPVQNQPQGAQNNAQFNRGQNQQAPAQNTDNQQPQQELQSKSRIFSTAERTEIRNDPAVQNIINTFGGEIYSISDNTPQFESQE